MDRSRAELEETGLTIRSHGRYHRRLQMSKKLAIVQSNYIPWKGYFDLIHAVDEFVLFDDVQYTRRDWRNRNRIKTREGTQWLTIPVLAKGNYLAPIKDIAISEPRWGEQHWKTLVAAYARAPFFKVYEDLFASLYLAPFEPSLSAINRSFIEAICGLLGIRTKITASMDYEVGEGKNERLIALCLQAGADAYVSGPSARSYLDESLFRNEGIRLEFFDYAGYPEYPQLHPPFDHGVSVLDLLFHLGPDAPAHMLTFGPQGVPARDPSRAAAHPTQSP
jgi:hypothetical protein